jgi:hypothetical protein
MKVEDAVRMIMDRTTDRSGHIASFSFRDSKAIGFVEARLEKGVGSPKNWKIVWHVHWRDESGQERRESSDDLSSIMSRFGPVDLEASNAKSLAELI